MDKKEVEEILIKIKLGQDDALNMKIYKNGTLCRQGCGGVPEVGISGMSFSDSSEIFDKLIEKVPQEILDNSINHEDEKINVPLEYIICFYGVSKNGDTGERAEWTKSTGHRFLLDSNTTFQHPIIGFIDNFAMDAADITNSWYFDIIVNAFYEFKSNKLPDQSIISIPPTDKGKQTSFENYVNQINDSVRKWDLLSFAENKIYKTKDEVELKAAFVKKGSTINFRFLPINVTTNNEKPWWKIW